MFARLWSVAAPTRGLGKLLSSTSSVSREAVKGPIGYESKPCMEAMRYKKAKVAKKKHRKKQGKDIRSLRFRH